MSEPIRWAARPTDSQQSNGKSAQAWATTLMALYETDPAIIAAVLPEPLSPSSQPLVRVSISQVTMDSGYTFGAGGFAVACRHGDVEGFYPLTMPMGGEAAVVGGREVYGEPKKLADINLQVDGDSATASVSRMGVTYMEIQAKACADTVEQQHKEASLDFYFKFLVAPDFKGFDQDPSLVYCRRDTTIRNTRKMQGDVILRDSDADPVADLPVRRMLDITLSERQASQRGEIIQQVASDLIAPFAHQRYDQFSWT